MAEHEHGSMDIEAHEKTFSGFIKVCALVLLHTFLILIVLAIFRT